MTSNQIAYWNLEETKRRNLVVEEETHRHNSVMESQGYMSIQEQARHNRSTESISWANLAEVRRHNKAGENLTAQDISERHRHNLITEQVQYGQLSNAEYLAELQRLDLERKVITDQSQHDARGQEVAQGWISTLFGRGGPVGALMPIVGAS
nr:putative ORF1 [Marmot picobirnavirus]